MKTLTADSRGKIQAMLADQPGIVLETVARAFDIPVADVVACLPGEEQASVPGEHFVAVMEDIATWGKVTAIVNTEEMVFEAKGEIARGSLGRGWYNVPGAIGGHFNPDGFSTVSFVTRTLMGKPSRSVLFFNRRGDCVFKVYLGRDADGAIIASQIDRFEALKARLAAAA